MIHSKAGDANRSPGGPDAAIAMGRVYTSFDAVDEIETANLEGR
jgi:hypothetical protein